MNLKPRFLILAVLLLFPLVLQAATRPNFLFIYADDQRYDALSVVQKEQGEKGRFPWFQTPNMDRLAKEGVRFRNAFVVNSLCAPSRAVFLTGQYNHRNGIASNFRPFPVTNVTHASILKTAGYTTGYIGKWHMDSQRERPGFDFHASFIGHARYVDPDFIVNGKDVATKGWIDDISTDYAIKFLREQKESTKPWSLIIGFKSPHGPFEPPERAQKRFENNLARTVPNLNVSTAYMGKEAKRRSNIVEGLTPVNLDYFRCVSAIDDALGRLLDELDKLGFTENTLVIYTSDNGFYMGEHGLGDKRSAYDESLRIPFLARYPALGKPACGRVVDSMILNLDLAQTLLDFAGLPAPSQMQGRSWRKLLTGESVTWRESWFYEYFAEKQRNSRVPDITAVRTTKAKLIKYSGHDEWTELFDLQSDPFETRNIYAQAGYAALRDQLEKEHQRLAVEVGYRVPEYVDRPDWWDKPGGADWQPDSRPELRLHYRFLRGNTNQVSDLSGKGLHGKIHTGTGGELIIKKEGREGFVCNQGQYIEVPKSSFLNPARSAWTLEAVILSEKPDGIILARGGRTQGYALWLKDGCPQFTVVVGNTPYTVSAKQPITGWTTLIGTIHANRKFSLRINSEVVATGTLPDFIENDPSDGMQIGADLGSPVVYPAPSRWLGLVEQVRIYSGEAVQ